MADSKLSALATATSVDYLYGISGGVSKKIGGGGLLLSSGVVTVSSADILAFHNTEKVIVAAPGVGKILTPIEGHMRYIAGGTPYVNGGGSVTMGWAGYDFDAAGILDFDNMFTQATDQYAWSISAQENFSSFAISMAENKALVIKINPEATPFSDGDGTAEIEIFYRIRDV